MYLRSVVSKLMTTRLSTYYIHVAHTFLTGHLRVRTFAGRQLSFFAIQSNLKGLGLLEGALLLSQLADLAKFVKTLIVEEVVTGLQDLL